MTRDEGGASPARQDPLAPNVLTIARREYLELVRRRAFRAATLALAALAVFLAFLPVLFRAIDQGTVTTIGVAATDTELRNRATAILDGVLNGGFAGPVGERKAFLVEPITDLDAAVSAVASGSIDAALVATRQADGGLDFQFYTGETVGADRAQIVSVGALAVAMLDWTARQQVGGGPSFNVPTFESIAAGGPTAGGRPVTGAEFAGSRIVGIVFLVMIFITLVFYGMWVATGVASEKSGRVMELLVSAASPAQLVIGKILGIGLAGATQYVGVLVPTLIALLIQDRVGELILGPDGQIQISLATLSPGLLLAFGVYFVLGFALYALMYAAAGSLVSRLEDLQVIALPLSIIAIAGYGQAVLALSGGTTGFIRLASFIPFWSPFVMLTRLTIGRVEPVELIVSLALLALTIPIVLIVAIRVYAAGVLLYGQRPGLRQFVAAAIGR